VRNEVQESDEYLHLVAEGIPEGAAQRAVWIDRAYKHLVGNGMAEPQAYAEATAAWVASNLNFDALEPEAAIDAVLGEGHKAQQQFARLDPTAPAASYFLQRRPPAVTLFRVPSAGATR
jgi:hypothetical protein